MALQAPERDQAVTIRLSVAEKERLSRVAIARDVRVGQLVRQIVNQHLTATGTQTEGPHDGRVAH